ncbi:alpha/beta hydrolase [Agreia sp. COWG]|uniref:alpha/beta hydrolase n=1 Tax=Agreia sp. COWG TaxID=2773266 RepID=UPI0019284133|nr:alpha/beta hydrolase [Agreia sp. COWG]
MAQSRRPWYRRKRIVLPAASLGLGLITAIVWAVSPWPASLAIRTVFTKGANDTVAEMTPYVPASGIDEKLDVSYAGQAADTTLDVFSPTGTSAPLTTVVWIHGGAWISGSKENVDPYVKIIASHGYTTVALNYTVSPETSYPVALKQLNTALGYLVEHAAEYNIDPSRLVLAGDSAGAQLTSQLANLTTNPAFARELGITPRLQPDQLAAVILNCGIYDVSEIPNAPGIGGWGFRVALWAYLGEKDWSNTKAGDQMSSVDYVTAAFPRTYISGGNGDPLTATQSQPFAEKLTSLGVPVTSVFYAPDHEPKLPHEYQFHLDYPDAQTALESTLEFLKTLD